MSASLVHILTVIGKGAGQSEAACETLLGRWFPTKTKGYGSLNWSDVDHKNIEQLCTALLRNVHKLPVLYYAQYLDYWSVAASMFRLLESPDGKRRIICGINHNLAYYPSRYVAEFLAQVSKWQQTEMYQEQAEDRWYLDHINEAIKSAQWLNADFLTLAITESFDLSPLDEEITASLEIPIDLPNFTA